MCFETEDGDGDENEEDRQRRDHLYDDNETNMSIAVYCYYQSVYYYRHLIISRPMTADRSYVLLVSFFNH